MRLRQNFERQDGSIHLVLHHAIFYKAPESFLKFQNGNSSGLQLAKVSTNDELGLTMLLSEQFHELRILVKADALPGSFRPVL